MRAWRWLIEVLAAVFVLRLVQGHDLGGGLVQPLGTVGQLGVGAAALFAGVAGQLDAVDGEHGLADQAQAVAGHEHLGEQRADLGPELAHELGDVGVAGRASPDRAMNSTLCSQAASILRLVIRPRL